MHGIAFTPVDAAAILFLLIGLEGVAIPGDARLLFIGAISIGLVIVARAISVSVPSLAMRPWRALGGRQAPATLIWGGLRGGIPIALALGLPDGPARSLVLAATYIIVLFSVILQGGTIARVVSSIQASRPLRTG